MIDYVEHLSANMFRTEVEPCAAAAHDERARRLGGSRISSAIYEASGGPLTSKNDDGRSRHVGDKHDQRTDRGKEKPVEQPKNQYPAGRYHSGPEFGPRFDAQTTQFVEANQVRRSHQYDRAEHGSGRL
jgi:hypothetical protein